MAERLGEARQQLQPTQGPRPPEPEPCDQLELQRCACSILDFDAFDPRKPLRSSQRLGTICNLPFDPACNLCRVIRTAGRLDDQADTKTVYVAAVHTSVLIRCRSTHANDWWEPRETGTVDDTTSYLVLVPRRQIQESWEIREAGYAGFISPVRDPTSTGTWYARRLTPHVNVSLIQGWLTFCNENHAAQCFSSPEAHFAFPLRLIDCTSRQVVWPIHGLPYVALSYVLGQSRSIFSPGQQDLPVQLPSILAPTIDDAIIITKNLGVRYLWVDQYCIDQSNPQDRTDQINQMDSIYRGAWLTIVAAAGHDVSHGLPGVFHRARKSRRVATIKQNTITTVPPMPNITISKSTWIKRGWTYQEAILSHRLLIFGPSEVYFECEGFRCSEIIDMPFEFDDVRLSPNEWVRRSLFPSITPRQTPSLFEDIFLHISNFSKRHLTYSFDKLNAIRGIFQSFENMQSDIWFYGGLILVPDNTLKSYSTDGVRPFTRTEQLLRSLCWLPGRRGVRTPEFPSFSWLGWSETAGVDAPYGHMVNTFDVKVYFDSLEGTELSSKRFAKCPSRQMREGRSLRLDASTIRATVVKSDKGRPASGHYFVVFIGTPNIMMKNYVKLTVRNETSDSSDGDRYFENLLAIPLGELLVQDDLADYPNETPAAARVHREHVALLAKEVDGGWERIGLAMFSTIIDSYFIPPSLHLPDGSTAHKSHYTPEAFRRVPFARQEINLL